MANGRHYEEQILRELKSLPEEALPKVLHLLSLVREEFLAQGGSITKEDTSPKTNHEKTRALLTTSTGNWAQELIAEREDRL